jgi:hypothetical protein
VLNVVRRRPWSYPHMQMNVYNLSRLAHLLRARGVEEIHVRLHESFSGYESCTIVFRREA